MIRGVGVDLCAISRIAAILERHAERFVARVFTPAERDYCRTRGLPAQHFAARFAAKEATLKALGVPPGLRWQELEVASDGGAPRLALHGAAAAAATARGVTRTHLSLSHAGDTAVAFVVLEGGDDPPAEDRGIG